jgi:DNA polymerase zeta
VKEHIRRGVLPQMLREILDTRLMVKKSMKLHKNDKTLQRILHARQLGLKLIANVTYGYTSANFSGRMPCIEARPDSYNRRIEMVSSAVSSRWPTAL